MSDTIRQVDVMALFGALKTKGEAKLSDFATPIETTINNSTNEIKEDKTMRLNLNANQSENNNVQPTAQVMNITTAAAAKPAEDAVAEEIKDEPKAKPATKSKPKAKSKPAPKAKAEPEAVYSVEEYTTKKQKTAALLFGFATLEDAQALADKMSKTVSATWRYDADRKEKRYALSLGARYVAIAHDLCRALNRGDKAAIDKACEDSIAVYSGAVAEGKAKSEERKAERAAAKAAKEQAKATAKSADDKEKAMFELFKKFMAGDKATMKMVGEMVKKAA